MNYEINFHEHVDGQPPKVTINEETFSFRSSIKKKGQDHCIVWSIQSHVEAMQALEHKHNCCAFRINSPKDNAHSLVNLSSSKVMKDLAKLIIEKRFEGND